MIKFENDKTKTATPNAQAEFASLSDEELIPALLEQVVGGASIASIVSIATTCFKADPAGLSSIATTCFKASPIAVRSLDLPNLNVSLGNLANVAGLRG